MNLFSRKRDAVAVRDPRAAMTNISYISPGSPMVEEWSAEEAFRFGYLSNIVAYRCVNIIAETVASLPFRAGRSLAKPEDFNEGAPLARLLGPPPYGPNPEMAADELWHNAVCQYLVAGRFGWEIARNGRTIDGLWPLAAQRLRAVPTTAKTSRAYFESFLYGRPGDETQLSADDVFYMWRPSLHDYRQPESALQAARYDIAVAVMQDRYDNAFLRNDAKPASIMIVQRFAEQAKYQAFKDQVNAEYGGPDNAGKMMIQEAEGDENGRVKDSMVIQPLGLSQKDAEFIQRHEMKFRNIAIALGVPWSKLDSSGRTWDNADKEDETWEESTIIPLVRRLQNHVNMKLAPKLGTEVGWFEIKSLKSSQPAKKFTQVPVTEAYKAGIISLDEAREDVGEEALADGSGEEFYTAPTPPPPPQMAIPAQPELPPAPVQEPPRQLPKPDEKARRSRIYAEHLAKVDAQELTWRRSFKRLFAEQEATVLKRLEGKRAKQALRSDQRALWDETFDADHWAAVTQAQAMALYEMTYTVSGVSVAARFDVSFDIEAPNVQHRILNQASELSRTVNDTTMRAIREQLAEGVAQGEGIPKLSERVKAVFDTASKARSEMIARTEVSNAFNSAAVEVVRDLPSSVVAGKVWIGEGDNDICNQYAAMPPIGVGDSWDGLDSPPSHPHCRCTVGFLTPDEMAAATAGRSFLPVDGVQKRLAKMALRRVA